MEQTKEVAIRDINDILEAVSRIERQVELIKQGKTEVGETGVNRLDVIKEKAMLIRIIGKRMQLLHTTAECCRSGGFIAQKPIKSTTVEHSTNVH